MTTVNVIYKNEQGDIQVLPITETDMPQNNDSAAWDAFYRKLTAQYITDHQVNAFLGQAKAKLYRSTANFWAVFGFDVRPGLDDHTIRFVRFAYRNEQEKTCWPANSHPPMAAPSR